MAGPGFGFDDLEGNGTWFCNYCRAGVGLHLLQKVNGWDYATPCRKVDKIIGTGAPAGKPNPPPHDWKRYFRDIQAVINGATDPAVVSRYLTRRGLTGRDIASEATWPDRYKYRLLNIGLAEPNFASGVRMVVSGSWQIL